MSLNVQQNIATLGDVLEAMAPAAGGSVPPLTDPEYSNWVSWVNQGQEDAANRGFWSRLLTKGTLSVVNGENTALLPSNFHKRNGIFILNANEVDWSDPANEDTQKLFVHLNPTSALWEVVFTGFTPTVDLTADLWYFFLPPKLVNESDKLFLDGKMILYYALAEYYRVSGELGSLDDTRNEYNNRFSEGLNIDQLPAKNELVSWSSIYANRGSNPNERQFYRGRRF